MPVSSDSNSFQAGEGTFTILSGIGILLYALTKASFRLGGNGSGFINGCGLVT